MLSELNETDLVDLDRAIEAGMLKTYGAQFKFNVDDHDRTYARALVAELLRGMVDEIQGGCSNAMFQFDQGYVAALAEIRRRAGLEGEG